jgi:WD40 repeat protein
VAAAYRLDQVCDRFETAWKEGPPPQLEAFLADTPEPARTALLRELIALDLTYRRGTADEPTPEDYQRRFPEHGPLIQAVFHDLAKRTPLGPSPTPPELAREQPPPGQDNPAQPTRAYVQGHRPNPPVAGPAAGKDPELREGSFLGDYEILTKIGGGGMGVVFRARQRRADRIVALKVIRYNVAEELPVGKYQEWLDRFRREALLTARVEHDAIVTVYEVGECQGQPFYSMRYVEGQSLSQLARQGPLDNRRAAAYLERVARAVQHAHGCGVLHRDLKPSNILLDADDRPVVTDFGLAKWLEGTHGFTDTGSCLGSPPYMAPEQVRDSARVTVESDVYSLGATLYDLVTGRPPFQAARVAETLNQVIHQEPVPPRQLNPAIDRDLETITLKCLHKEPTRRYRTAAELADDLRRYLHDEPIRARRTGPAERLWRWGRRNPLVASLAGAVILLVLFLLALTSIGYWNVSQAWQEAKDQRDQTREMLRTALLDQAKAQRLSAEAGRRWSALDALRRAAEIRPGPELRDEYLRCLDLADVRPVATLVFPAELKPGPAPLPAIPGDAPSFFGLLGHAVHGTDGHGVRAVLTDGPTEWNLHEGHLRGLGGGLESFAPPAVLSPNGRFFAARLQARQETRVWDLNTNQCLGVLPFGARVLAFSDQSDRLALAHALKGDNPREEGQVEILVYRLTAKGLEQAGSWKSAAPGLDCLKFQPRGTWLAATMGLPPEKPTTFGVRLWDPATGKEVHDLPLELWQGSVPTPVAPHRIGFSPDGRYLALVRGGIRVWDLSGAEPQEVWRCSLEAQPADAVTLSPDARWVVTVGRQGQVKVWDARVSRLLAVQTDLNESPPPSADGFPPAPHTLLLSDLRTAGRLSGARLWELAFPLSRVVPAPHYHLSNSQKPEQFALTFSPDDRWLAYAYGPGNESAPYLIDLQQLDTPPAPLEEGMSRWGTRFLAFSPAGDRLWSASRKPQRLWSLPARRAGQQPGPEMVVAAAFAADGRVAGYLREQVQLTTIDLTTGREVWAMAPTPGNTDQVSRPLFSPDGKYLLVPFRVAAEDGPAQAQVWDCQQGKPVCPPRTGGSGHFFFQDQQPVTLLDEASLAFKDLLQDRPQRVMPRARSPHHNYQVFSKFAFSPDGRLCAETGINGDIALWECAGPERSQRPLIRRRRPASFNGQDLLAFSPDGTKITAFDGPDHLAVWDTRTGKELGRVKLEGRPDLFAFAESGRELLLAYLGRRVQTWRFEGEEVRLQCRLETEDGLEREKEGGWWRADTLLIADAVALSGDRHQLVYVSRPDAQGFHTAYIWELPSGKLTTRRLARQGNGWPRVALNRDGTRLAVLGTWAEIQVSHLDTGADYVRRPWRDWTPDNRIEALNRMCRNIGFSPDGAYLAVVEDQGQEWVVRVFHLPAGAEVFAQHLPRPVSCLALAAGGRMLALDQNNQILVFELHTTRRQVAALHGPKAGISDLAFDRNAALLVSVSTAEKMVRLWDPGAGIALATLPTDPQDVYRVAVSPSGRWLAGLDYRGGVRLWDLAEVRHRLDEVGLNW